MISITRYSHVQDVTAEMKPTTKKARLSDMRTGLMRLHSASAEMNTDVFTSTTVSSIRDQENRPMCGIFTIS